MKPAYDLTDPYDAFRYLEDSRDGWAHPFGQQHLWASRLAQVSDAARRPRSGGQEWARPPEADEALAVLTLITALRAWLTETEPAMIGAARAAGATWEQLAGPLGVGDRRAAHRRAARLGAEFAASQPAVRSSRKLLTETTRCQCSAAGQ